MAYTGVVLNAEPKRWSWISHAAFQNDVDLCRLTPTPQCLRHDLLQWESGNWLIPMACASEPSMFGDDIVGKVGVLRRSLRQQTAKQRANDRGRHVVHHRSRREAMPQIVDEHVEYGTTSAKLCHQGCRVSRWGIREGILLSRAPQTRTALVPQASMVFSLSSYRSQSRRKERDDGRHRQCCARGVSLWAALRRERSIGIPQPLLLCPADLTTGNPRQSNYNKGCLI